MDKKIILGSDHAGYLMKEHIKKLLDESKLQYEDLGVFDDKTKSDYPTTAEKVAKQVAKSHSRGILICGTGIGESIVANKVKGIRAANCTNEFMATMSREHNDSNILCLGARVLDEDKAKSIAKTWLETKFSGEERHVKRIDQINQIEEKDFK